MIRHAVSIALYIPVYLLMAVAMFMLIMGDVQWAALFALAALAVGLIDGYVTDSKRWRKKPKRLTKHS